MGSHTPCGVHEWMQRIDGFRADTQFDAAAIRSIVAINLLALLQCGRMVTMTVTEIAAHFHTFANPANETAPTRPTRRRKGSRALLLTQSDARAGRLRRRLGVERERTGLDAYARQLDVAVSRRNDQTMRIRLDLSPSHHILVSGRPDGFCEQTSTIIEHKYRTHKLLPFVPTHERVQCHVYMKMLGVRRARLVQTFGTQTRVHEFGFSEGLWIKIVKVLLRTMDTSDFVAME